VRKQGLRLCGSDFWSVQIHSGSGFVLIPDVGQNQRPCMIPGSPPKPWLLPNSLRLRAFHGPPNLTQSNKSGVTRRVLDGAGTIRILSIGV